MKNAAGIASEQIVSLVQSMQLHPGAKLPGERSLAGALGWSRNTIREALVVLAERGMVEVRMRSGVYLRAEAGTGHDDGIAKLQEAVETLSMVGPALVERTCRVASADDHDRAEHITARLGRALVDRNPHAAWRGMLAFYTGLAKGTGNTLLEGIIANIDKTGAVWCASPTAPELPPAELQRFFAGHVEMLQAMRGRDIPQAVRRAAESIAAFGQMLVPAGWKGAPAAEGGTMR